MIISERSRTGTLWVGPPEAKSWAWRFWPSHCRHVGSTYNNNSNSLACLLYATHILVEINYRFHDGGCNKTLHNKKTHLLFDLLQRRLVVMCSSSAHFTFLRLLLNYPNYCVYRRAVSLNTTRHSKITIMALYTVTHVHNDCFYTDRKHKHIIHKLSPSSAVHICCLAWSVLF